jgi:type IV pilus assembly protein PilB
MTKLGFESESLSKLEHAIYKPWGIVLVTGPTGSGKTITLYSAIAKINSALTGHLVFTTVHANNVLDVLGRFLNMGVEAYQFVSALNCVLAQRLVRNICVHCKRPARVSRILLEESGLDPSLEHTHTFYEGVGCIECGGTGYMGRTAICELLDLSDAIREMILEKRPTSEIKKAARDEGMRFLRESAVERVMLGITTLREINKVTFVE